MYNKMDPEQFAGLVFNMVATFPASPLDQLLSSAQLQQLRAAYMSEALIMAEGMCIGNEGIALYFTMQWVTATARDTASQSSGKARGAVRDDLQASQPKATGSCMHSNLAIQLAHLLKEVQCCWRIFELNSLWHIIR